MYSLREKYLEFFKEIRTRSYTIYTGCDKGFISSVINGNKRCSEVIAKALISIRCDISFKNENMDEYLEKYFAKEK